VIGIIDESTPWLSDDRSEVLESRALVVIPLQIPMRSASVPLEPASTLARGTR
jgi:hypothetical protein